MIIESFKYFYPEQPKLLLVEQELFERLSKDLAKLAPPKEVAEAWNIITGWLLTAMGTWAAEKRELEDLEEGYSPCLSCG